MHTCVCIVMKSDPARFDDKEKLLASINYIQRREAISADYFVRPSLVDSTLVIAFCSKEQCSEKSGLQQMT